MFCATIQTASYVAMGSLGTAANPSDRIKAGIIAMMVVFTFGYSVGWASTAHILSTEIPSLFMRDMTYSKIMPSKSMMNSINI